MRHIFLSIDARRRDMWLQAFAKAEFLGFAGFSATLQGEALLWVLVPPGESAKAVLAQHAGVLKNRPFVVLSDTPSEAEAMDALEAGASGYCNGHAAPEVLKQVAMVVENGGIWVGRGLMQKFLAATARFAPESKPDQEKWRKLLTAREQEVALLLARGASNKEIARQFDITERTVKAHVSAMLDKLGVRDRLQLSLIINGID